MSKKPAQSPDAPPAVKLTPRERFVKHAARRVNNALRALRNVQRLGNQASYTYSEQEAEAIKTAIADAARKVGAAFFAKKAEEQGFTLPL